MRIVPLLVLAFVLPACAAAAPAQRPTEPVGADIHAAPSAPTDVVSTREVLIPPGGSYATYYVANRGSTVITDFSCGEEALDYSMVAFPPSVLKPEEGGIRVVVDETTERPAPFYRALQAKGTFSVKAEGVTLFANVWANTSEHPVRFTRVLRASGQVVIVHDGPEAGVPSTQARL